MNYELIQKSILPGNAEVVTTDTAPQGTTQSQAIAYFEEMLTGAKEIAAEVATDFDCGLSGSVELIEIASNGQRKRLRYESYTVKS